MSFGPQVAMSGAFHFEAPNGASPMSGVHAGIFQPPMSPSTSSSVYLSKSNGSMASDAQTPAPNINRKRLRHGEMTPSHDGMMNGGYTTNDRLGERRISGGREIRYTLGGQIETPNGMVQNQLGGDMDSSMYSDVDYRRALGPQRAHDEHESTEPGQSRTDLPMEPQPAQPTGWLSAFALNTIGGVVGKVWEFCKMAPFRGFYAGGGRAFDAQANPLPGNDEAFQMALEYGHSPAPTPGGFPESDYTPFFHEQEPDSTPPPAAKRRQISANTPSDELRKNWVMVNENEPAEQMTPPPAPVSHQSMDRPSSALQNRPSIPRRISKPVSRLSTAPNFNRRHSGRISHAGDPSLTFREPASFAGPRSMMPAPEIRPSTPMSTPSRLPVASRPQSPAVYTPSPRQPSRIPSPSPHILRGNHRRNHSAASAASVGLVATPGKVAPVRRRETLVEERSPRLDPEAQELVARRLREERAEDARINDFNARLQAMIRQGQEALGTSFEGEREMGYGGGASSHWDDEY
ncbi:hypothetical protein PG993_003016 [Apiospora rasikravindrae]|uniref:Uncharacterized protein n=1 Tax=Apiospora rasikravindrae TaxID=990691 RepID=A0ABR1TY97_9PEZI